MSGFILAIMACTISDFDGSLPEAPSLPFLLLKLEGGSPPTSESRTNSVLVFISIKCRIRDIWVADDP